MVIIDDDAMMMIDDDAMIMTVIRNILIDFLIVSLSDGEGLRYGNKQSIN